MSRKTVSFFVYALGLIVLAGMFFLPACGEDVKGQSDLAAGNWTHYRNRAYVLLIVYPRGEWDSTVRIADVTGKIVKSKGKASGTWYIENNQMIFTVAESDIDNIWEKNSTNFYDILEIADAEMKLQDTTGQTIVWKKTSTKQSASATENLDQIISMGPVTVNLNKNRSNDKDRYLCMNLNLILRELMPDQELPAIHPKAREAAIIFLSSLVFNDVKDFDSIKKQNKKLTSILNPYMLGMVKEVAVEHVIVATDIDKVEEFIIEHTLTEEPVPEEGEEGEKTDEKAQKEKQS